MPAFTTYPSHLSIPLCSAVPPLHSAAIPKPPSTRSSGNKTHLSYSHSEDNTFCSFKGHFTLPSAIYWNDHHSRSQTARIVGALVVTITCIVAVLLYLGLRWLQVRRRNIQDALDNMVTSSADPEAADLQTREGAPVAYPGMGTMHAASETAPAAVTSRSGGYDGKTRAMAEY